MHGLTVVSLNIAAACIGEGLDVVIHVLASLRAHVALLQEFSRVQETALDRVAALEQAGWEVYASPPAAEGRHPVHTAILVRRSSIAEGQLRVRGPQLSGADGRCLNLLLEWNEQPVAVTCVYLPACGGLNHGGQGPDEAISSVLHLWTSSQHNVAQIVGGDWNCVLDSADRASHSCFSYDTAAYEAWTAADMDTYLMDAWRASNPPPAPVDYTFVPLPSIGLPARLDRFYVSRALAPRIRCFVSPFAVERHLPVVLELKQAAPAEGTSTRSARRAAPSRVKLLFDGHDDLCDLLRAWCAHETLQLMELSYEALLSQWPEFKRRLAAYCGALNAEARARAPLQARIDAEAALRAAQAALKPDVLAAVPGEALTVAELEARAEAFATAWAAWRATVIQENHKRAHAARLGTLRAGEYPQPAFTPVVQGKRSGGARTALRDPAAPTDAELVTDAAECAELTARTWAAVSRSTPIAAEALARVETAVLSQGPLISDAAAAAAGSPTVTLAEVRWALRRARPGTAPGPDGLVLQIYRRCSASLAPLLARLFSAAGALRRLPRGFALGALHTIPKTSPPSSNPTEYRPITLLGVDYRLLAAILARRLERLMRVVAPEEQTAFLQGRSSGENVLGLQGASGLGGLEPSGKAVVVLLDFAKAYDTIDRRSLLVLASALGVGNGMLAWIRMLLRDTRALAVVGKCASRPHVFAAGVRQGCPLSPTLYLCVATALWRFLKMENFTGAVVRGHRVHSRQYADDMQVVLQSIAEVPALLAALATFAQATGQHTNVDKTTIVPLCAGALADVTPATAPPDASGVVNVAGAVSAAGATGSASAVDAADAADAAGAAGAATAAGAASAAGMATAANAAGAVDLGSAAGMTGAAGAAGAAGAMGAAGAAGAANAADAADTAGTTGAASTAGPGASAAHDAVGATGAAGTAPAAIFVAGLRVAPEAKILGIPFRAYGVPLSDPTEWLEDRIRQALRGVQRLRHLSPFGRGPCASGYGVSTALHHAELQPLTANRRLQQLIAAFVFDNTVLSETQSRTGQFAATMAASLVSGRPRDGGFGALPTRNHMRARHAKWGVKLILQHQQWASSLRTLLVQTGLAPPLVEAHPLALLELAAGIVRKYRQAASTADAPGRFAEPAVRCLAALPHIRDVRTAFVGPAPAALPLVELSGAESPALLQPGAVLAAPVWGNPYLNGIVLRPSTLRDSACASRIACIGDLLAVSRGALVLTDPATPTVALRRSATKLWRKLPADWRAAAESAWGEGRYARVTDAARAAGVAYVARHWGWRAPDNLPAGGVSLASVTVRSITTLLEYPTRALRATKLAAFTALALDDASFESAAPAAQPAADDVPPAPSEDDDEDVEGLEADAPAATRRPRRTNAELAAAAVAAAAAAAEAEREAAEVLRLMAALWRLPWQNKVKSVFWLLALDGIKCGARVLHSPDSRCLLCEGDLSHDRRHVFWHCEGAQAIREAIQGELGHLGISAPLRPRHLWLMRRPSRAIHHDIWRVVCLAALAGMEAGRCAAWVVPTKSPEMPGHLAARIVRACALASFRAMLADYAALGVCRPAARASVAPPARPFFFVAHPTNPAALALRPRDT